MASAALPVASTRNPHNMDKIIEFTPERLKAPFFLRCAALCLDYMILLSVPVVWLLVSRFLSDTGTGSIGTAVWILGFVLFAVNFLLLPLLRGQTVGKMLTGLTILNSDGTRLDVFGVLRRHVLGYAATLLTLGLGFLLAALNVSGRSLHDLIAGTVVVRGTKTPV